MVIKLVSAERLKKEFDNVETDKINELSCADADKIVESLVYKMLKGFKHGRIFDNPEMNDAIDELNNFSDKAKYKFNNVNAVINNNKFNYLLNAYITANSITINNMFSELNAIKTGLNSNLSANIHYLELLLDIYYFNYSNSGMLQELMFNLSADDDIPLTFEIHDKYVFGDEFGFNHHLMKDLDFDIKAITETILKLIDHMDTVFNPGDVDIDKKIDDSIADVKNSLKTIYGDADDFKTISLSESGFDDALIESIKIEKDNLSADERYVILLKSS